MNEIVTDTYSFNRVGGCPISMDNSNLHGGLSLIESELKETSDAVSDLAIAFDSEEAVQSIVEIADGAADIVVTAIGLLYRAGMSEDEVQRILSAVGKANLAKFDTNEEDAQKSVEAYQGDRRYFDVTYEKHGDYYVVIGKYASENGVVRKILKSHKWKAPESEILSILTGV